MIQHGTIVLVHVEVAVKDKAAIKPLPSPISGAAREGSGVAVDGAAGMGASGGGNGASGDEQAADKHAGREEGLVYVGNSSSSNDAGSSQIDSKTACNSATACASSDLTHATVHRLHPETRATTAPGQSGSLSGSDSNGLGSCFASAHASEPNTSNDSGSKSLGTSSSKSESGSKEEASDTGGVAVDGQEGVQGSSGGAGGESQTQPQRVDGEADGAGNSAGGGQRENEDADQDSKDKGRHDAEKAAKTQTDFVVHVEFTDDSAHEGHCQVGRSLK